MIADHAEVAIVFSAMLYHHPTMPASSATDTTTLVVSSIKHIWQELRASPKPLNFSLSFNRNEKDSSHSSRAQIVKKRPDSMVIVHKFTLLLGEDKHEDLESAYHDLRRKRATLLRVHYRDVQFLMGYVAAGTCFQWCFLHAAADKACSSMDVTTLVQWLYRALRSLVHAPFMDPDGQEPEIEWSTQLSLDGIQPYATV